MKKGKIIVFVGPSGVGKATIEKYLLKMPQLKLEFSISATTRKPRTNEKDGREYYFISEKKFIELINKNSFIEWSNHFNLYYGTLISEVEKITNSGKNAFLEVETNGALEIINSTPKKSLLTIFVMPPSIKDLEKRIRNRNTETNIEITKRLKKAHHEIFLAPHFDYVIVNDNNHSKKTAEKIAKIIMENC